MANNTVRKSKASATTSSSHRGRPSGRTALKPSLQRPQEHASKPVEATEHFDDAYENNFSSDDDLQLGPLPFQESDPIPSDGPRTSTRSVNDSLTPNQRIIHDRAKIYISRSVWHSNPFPIGDEIRQLFEQA